MPQRRLISRLFTDYYFQPTVEIQAADAPVDYPNLTRQSSVSTVSTTQTSSSDVCSSEAAKGERLFVARISSHVTEDEMRKYFEQFGTVKDAYIPRESVKNAVRCIGFVTFEDARTVDTVMGMRHSLGGADIVVDRAKPRPPKNVQKEETDIPVETYTNNNAWIGSQGQLEPVMFDPNWLGHFSAYGAYPSSNDNNCAPSSHTSDDGETSLKTGVAEETMEATAEALRGLSVHQISESDRKLEKATDESSIRKTKKNQRMTENSAHVQKVRGGPRLFVKKLLKETAEEDLIDYFSQFGRVLDVYIPRSKGNKKQRRDFGFITFETEDAAKMVLSHPQHCVNGNALSVEVAVPEKN